jgi:hypothetical protein
MLGTSARSIEYSKGGPWRESGQPDRLRIPQKSAEKTFRRPLFVMSAVGRMMVSLYIPLQVLSHC